MEYKIVELEEKILEGVGIKTTNENGKSIEDIAKLWQEFFKKGIYQKIENKTNQKTIGMYTEFEGDYTKPYKFYVAAEVSNKMEKNKDQLIIPKGKYAKFVIKGDVQKAVGELWSNIWKMDLDRAYICDFEEYQNNSENMQEQEIHVYISLK